MSTSPLDGSTGRRLRVSAVSYLNTLPLVWDFLYGDQKNTFSFGFSVPSVCAEEVGSGIADIGIIPCAELPALPVEPLLDIGITSRGPVRSILLISKVPIPKIRTLAVDSGSRTSVQLAGIILRERYGTDPRLIRHLPDLEPMLAIADAALIIGDPALQLNPDLLPYQVLDLGGEWFAMTGLPMVFAVWAGRPEALTARIREAFVRSCRWGLNHLPEIVREAQATRGFSPELVHDYLTRHIIYELGEEGRKGLNLFLSLLVEHQATRGLISQ